MNGGNNRDILAMYCPIFKKSLVIWLNDFLNKKRSTAAIFAYILNVQANKRPFYTPTQLNRVVM